MRDTFKKVVLLLGVGSRNRWVGLILLAILVSVLEAAAALIIYVLLAILTAPGTDVVVPVIGSLQEKLPQLLEPQGLLTAVSIAAVFFAARGVIYLVQSYLQNRLAYGTGSELARRLVRGYLAESYANHVSRNSAERIRNAHESTLGLAAYVLLPGIALAAEAFVTLALAVVLFLTSPLVAGGAFLFLAILVLLLLRLGQPRLLAMGRLVQDYTTISLNSLQQTLIGFRDIRVLGKEEFFEEEFASTRQRLARAYSVRGLLIDLPRVALETSVLFMVFGFIAFQILSDQPLAESTTLLGLFGYVAFRILPSVNRVVNNLQSLKFAAPLIDQLYGDAVSAEAVASAPSEADSFGPFESIEFRNVSFRYPGADADALSDVSFSIIRGQSIGIVGRTGSGKSTLLDLMLGLLEPTRGSITVNAKNLSGWSRAWHRKLGFVPQTIFILDDTIKRNIALGRNDSDIDERLVEEAARIAQLDDVLQCAPHGLDTPVGERGVKLSGGQRQRLALARALYRSPEVLLFDEGTSALDSQTELAFLGSLAMVNDDLTLVNVAHRVSTIRGCDVVILLTNGRIEAAGTYASLLEESQTFRALTQEGPGAPAPGPAA